MWGLVHSQRSADIRRGLDLAEQLLKSQELDGQDHKDLVYLRAVAQYRLGNVLDARRQLDELLAVSPHSRQVREPYTGMTAPVPNECKPCCKPCCEACWSCGGGGP